MPDPRLAPNNLLLFVIGRPGAGKSTFAKHLTRGIASTQVLYVNDYDLLVARAQKLDGTKVRWEANGRFEVIDRALFDSILAELAETIRKNRGKRPLIVEFSRPAYVDAFKSLQDLGSAPYAVVYIDAPLEVCVHRNEIRAPEYPIRAIPESVIRRYYADDDLAKLKAELPGRVRVVDNMGMSLQAVEREAILLLDELLGSENVIALRRSGHLEKEIFTGVILLGYLVLFASLACCTWLSNGGSSPLRVIVGWDRAPLLTSVLYVIAAGGLGSTTYCIRAMYHYYIRGVFDFDRFKWWYIFRPIAGCVLGAAAFAIFQGSVVVLGGRGPGTPTTNMTWFGVAFLAGFGTEQVIEWLRRASKSIFGESRVQPEDGAHN